MKHDFSFKKNFRWREQQKKEAQVICYRDRQYCSRECLNMGCDRNRRTIDAADLERTGLGVAVGDMRTDTCGYKPADPRSLRPDSWKDPS